MELGEKIEVKLYRYDPTMDEKPRYETYEVPYREKMRVLGALLYIREELGVDFSYDWICGCCRCGTCGVKMNGIPVLACWEPIMPKMVIEPLDNLTHVKDLVVAREELDESIERLNPRIIRKTPYPGFPEEITHEEMIHHFRLTDCTECGLCTSACPAVSLVGLKNFAGPAAYVKLAHRVFDVRDEGDRVSAIVDNGIFNCTSCLMCNEVCHMNIDVFGEAIEPVKRIAVTEKVYKLFKAYTSFEEAIKESGDVNPLILAKKIKGIKVLAELPRGLRLLAKGVLPLRQPANPGLEEVKKIIELTG